MHLQLLVLLPLLGGCVPAIEELSKHLLPSMDFSNPALKFLLSFLWKFHQVYTWLKSTSPVNIVFILAVTVYAVYLVGAAVREVVARLFGSKREFAVEMGREQEVRDIHEQIKTVQKEIRDINKAIRLGREQAKKQLQQTDAEDK